MNNVVKTRKPLIFLAVWLGLAFVLYAMYPNVWKLSYFQMPLFLQGIVDFMVLFASVKLFSTLGNGSKPMAMVMPFCMAAGLFLCEGYYLLHVIPAESGISGLVQALGYSGFYFVFALAIFVFMQRKPRKA